MLAKVLIIIALLAILYSLASSFFFLITDKGDGDRTARRLTWRVGLSLLLFLGIFAAYQMGLIEPGSGNPVRTSQPTEAAGEPPGND
jgi:hypothetical protein